MIAAKVLQFLWIIILDVNFFILIVKKGCFYHHKNTHKSLPDINVENVRLRKG